MSAKDKQVGGDHYRSMAVQPSEYIHRNGLNWCEGNAIKYITRHRIKGGRQDIEKAIHYLELLLELEYREEPPPQLDMDLLDGRIGKLEGFSKLDDFSNKPQGLALQGYPAPRCINCMQQPCRCLPLG